MSDGDSKWTHDDLAEDLARHLRANSDTIVWTNLQLGPSGSMRPDAYRIDRSYVKPRPLAYEVKVHRSDFQRDIASGKWMNYLGVSEGVYFAVPTGLVKKNEIPEVAGLMVRGPEGWRAVKAARRSPVTVDEDVWLKLLIDGIDREVSRKRLERHLRNGSNVPDKLVSAAERKFGREAAKVMRSWLDLRSEVDYLTKRAGDMRAELTLQKSRQEGEVEAVWNELREAMELGPESSKWEVRDAVRSAKRSYSISAARATKGSGLGRCPRLLLETVNANGPASVSQIAILSGYSVRSSTFANGLSELRTRHFIEGPREALRVTPAGRVEAGPPPPKKRGPQLVEEWMAKLGKCERALLAAILAVGPEGRASRARVAAASGYSETSSTFANGLSKLRVLELIEGGSELRASLSLFV